MRVPLFAVSLLLAGTVYAAAPDIKPPPAKQPASGSDVAQPPSQAGHTGKNPNAIEGAGPRNVYDNELIYKVKFGTLDDVRLLLKRGANPSQVNEIGWPLVSIAAAREDGQQVPILRELIKADADINQGGPNRMYPVIVAARKGDKPLMEFLLHEALADFNKRDPNGVYARDIAEKGGYTDIVAEIDQIQNERAEAIKRMYTPERRNQLIHDLLVQSCGKEYLTFYFKSKQDNLSPKEMNDQMSEMKGKLSVTTNDLVQIFEYPMDDLTTLSNKSANLIYQDLENLISNRNRRLHGIGSAGDLDKRCNAAARIIMQDMANAAAKKANKRRKTEG